MSSRLVVALRVRASPARAFDVFTREISLWWRPNSLFRFTPRDPGVLTFEPGEGGRLIETLADGKVFEIGRITDWSPPTRLVFGWRQATFAPEQTTSVEVRFEPVGDETQVTVTHTAWDQIPAAHVARHGMADAYFMRRHGEWWRDLLESFSDRLTGPDGAGS